MQETSPNRLSKGITYSGTVASNVADATALVTFRVHLRVIVGIGALAIPGVRTMSFAVLSYISRRSV